VAADVAAPYEFHVTSRNGNRSDDACFVIDVDGHLPCVTPVTVGGMVVRHLKVMAQRFVGHDQVRSATPCHHV
jgi:hypothetical protein